MICYKDRTFCGSKNCQNKCGRKITPEQIAHAESLELPIAYANFCDELISTPTENS